MLLTIDIGNTNSVFGCFDATNPEPIGQWRATTATSRTTDEWSVLLAQFLALEGWSIGDIEAVAAASVVPRVTGSFERLFRRRDIPLLCVSSAMDSGVELRVDRPTDVGADRIANAAAVSQACSTTAIVVDLGTATTLDVVAPPNIYLGGVILPGMETAFDALVSRAASLKHIPIDVPSSVIGKSTQHAVQSGVTYGVAAQIDQLVELISREVGEVEVIATGGLSRVVSQVSERITSHRPWLTLCGLARIAQRNGLEWT